MLIPTQKPEISRSELASAIGSLTDFFRDGEIDRLQPTGPAAVYTSSVTLWLLVLQRLASGSTLNEVVKDFIAHRPEFCPDNRRLDGGCPVAASPYLDGDEAESELIWDL